MQGALFIGDEVTATGFRLAGCDVLPGDADKISERFERACATYALIMLSAAAANRIDRAQLAARQRAVQPLVVVIPDIRGREATEDLTLTIKNVLGIAT